MQEEPVEPGGVVVGQVESGLALFEEVLVKLQRIREFGEFLLTGCLHHGLDGGFGIFLGGRGVAFDLGRSLLENVRQLGVTERLIANMNSAFGVNDGNNAKDHEKAKDAK